MKRNILLAAASLALAAVVSITSPAARAADVTPEEARAIAKDAYIYGFPLVDSYRIQYGYFVDRNSPEFKAPWNPGQTHQN